MTTMTSGKTTERAQKTQEEVTREWDALAGDWDDLALGSSSLGPNTTNPNAELFRRHVRPLLDHLYKDSSGTSRSGRRRRLRKQGIVESGGKGVLDSHVEEGFLNDNNDGAVMGDDDDDESDDGDDNDSDDAQEDEEDIATSRRPLRVVDFGCGTGIMIQHIIRHAQQQTEPSLQVQVLAIDASPQMVEMVRDKVQSREWGDMVTPICAVLARMPSLRGGGGGTSGVDDYELRRGPVKGNEVDKNALEFLREWVETADVVVSCCALSCVPEDDLDWTVHQLAALLRPDGTGHWVHCEWAEPEVDDEPDEGALDAHADGDAAPRPEREEIGGWRGPFVRGMSPRCARQLVSDALSLDDDVESVAVEVAGPLLFGVARTKRRDKR